MTIAAVVNETLRCRVCGTESGSVTLCNPHAELELELRERFADRLEERFATRQIPANPRFLVAHENGSYVKLDGRAGRARDPRPGTPVTPLSPATDLQLHLIDTAEGTEFHVLGRGNPFVTHSWWTAEAELALRLTTLELEHVARVPRASFSEAVTTHTWDSMHGWVRDGIEQALEELYSEDGRPATRLVVLAGGKGNTIDRDTAVAVVA